ncbi:hypothetical protein B0A49_09385, partial [Cryomyces minteri]
DGAVKRKASESLEAIWDRVGQEKRVKQKEQKEEVLRDAVDKRTVTEAVVRLIALHNLPHNAVEWPALRALILTVNYTATNVLPQSHTTVPAILKRSFLLHKDLLKRRMQVSLSKIHFTIDMWIGYFVGDKHTSNDKMCRCISTALAAKGIEWDPIHHRVRCNGHVVNLAVQAFLFAKNQDAVDYAVEQANTKDDDFDETVASKLHKAEAAGWREIGPLGKIHNFAAFVRSSDALHQAFLTLASKTLGLDNDTRWNSWFRLLTKALELRSAINEFTAIHLSKLQDDALSFDDWRFLELTAQFPQPFHRVTKETEGDFATLDMALFTMDVLVQHFKKSQSRYAANQALSSSILTGWYAFGKWYNKSDETAVYAAALILNPQRKMQYIKKN